jgi:hypothetical protein
VGEDTHKIEQEEKEKFLRVILEIVEVPLGFWNPEEPLSFDTKRKLHSELLRYNIEVLNDYGGDLEIYKDRILIGKCLKPTFKVKQDLKQINPRKKFYLEMEVQFESKLISEE